MTARGGKWVPLDQFNLVAGEQVQITISAQNANGYVIADGVRFSRVPAAANVNFTLPTVTFSSSPITLSGMPTGG